MSSTFKRLFSLLMSFVLCISIIQVAFANEIIIVDDDYTDFSVIEENSPSEIISEELNVIEGSDTEEAIEGDMVIFSADDVATEDAFVGDIFLYALKQVAEKAGETIISNFGKSIYSMLFPDNSQDPEIVEIKGKLDQIQGMQEDITGQLYQIEKMVENSSDQAIINSYIEKSSSLNMAINVCMQSIESDNKMRLEGTLTDKEVRNNRLRTVTEGLNITESALGSYNTAWDEHYNTIYKMITEPKIYTVNGQHKSGTLMDIHRNYVRNNTLWEHEGIDMINDFNDKVLREYLTLVIIEKMSLEARIELRERKGIVVGPNDGVRIKLNSLSQEAANVQSEYQKYYMDPKRKNAHYRYFWVPGHERLLNDTVIMKTIPNEPKADIDKNKGGDLGIYFKDAACIGHNISKRVATYYVKDNLANAFAGPDDDLIYDDLFDGANKQVPIDTIISRGNFTFDGGTLTDRHYFIMGHGGNKLHVVGKDGDAKFIPTAVGYAGDAKKSGDNVNVIPYKYVISRVRTKEYFVVQDQRGSSPFKPAWLTNTWGSSDGTLPYGDIPSDYICFHDRLKSGSTVCFLCGVDTKNDTVQQGHTHNKNLICVKGVKATCNKKGVADCYYCEECDDYYRDAEGKEQIPIPEMIDKKSHKFKQKVNAKATSTKDGNVTYSCKNCKYKYTGIVAKIKTVKLNKSKYKYTGKTIHPKVTVKDSNGVKIDSGCYKVTYQKGCKNPGKYKVEIKMLSPYKGAFTKYFEIRK